MRELATIPDLESAPLPVRYEAAKTALAECYAVDECKDWADKASALASYARQAKDDSLYKTAGRIHGRALRRVGELQKQFQSRGARTDKPSNGTDTKLTQESVAREAGLSKRQEVTASRIAAIPEDQFEELIESEQPPTVTELADLGKKSQPKREPGAHLQGRDPEVFAQATYGQGAVQYLVEKSHEYPAAIVAEGILPHERQPLIDKINEARAWLDDLQTRIQGDIDHGKD